MTVSAKHFIGVVIMLFAAFATGHAAADAPSDQDCEGAWTSSSATNSCGSPIAPEEFGYSVNTSQYTVGAHDGECRVEVHCMKGDNFYAPVYNDFVGSEDDVKSLNNCDGSLKTSSC